MPLSTTPDKTTLANRRGLTGLGSLVKLWSQRKSLNRLDDAALNDMGLTREQVEAEARRSFWDAAEPWQMWDESKTWRIWGTSKS